MRNILYCTVRFNSREFKLNAIGQILEYESPCTFTLTINININISLQYQYQYQYQSTISISISISINTRYLIFTSTSTSYTCIDTISTFYFFSTTLNFLQFLFFLCYPLSQFIFYSTKKFSFQIFDRSCCNLDCRIPPHVRTYDRYQSTFSI